MTIILSDKAKRQISEIKRYIAYELGSISAASNTVSKIIDAIDDLEYFPKRHRIWEKSEFRFFSVKNYLVFYRYNEAAEEIIIENIIYSRRNINELL